MRNILCMIIAFLVCHTAFSQEEDLLSLIDDENDESTEFVRASFKTNRVINLHSLENTSGGVLDFKIQHRFGFINTGIYELFGLDQSTIRLGLDYGITDRITIGLGRSSYNKTYDGFLKYKFLWQRKGAHSFPISASAYSSIAVETVHFEDPDRENYFAHRLSYAFMLIAGSKISEGFSIQIVPSLVHRNLVETKSEEHDVISIGTGLRQKLSKRVSINVEYIYVLPNQIKEEYNNSFSIGFDIETGGHVFQLHFTNSTGMYDKAYITETTGAWKDGEIRFGFNISRVFTIAKRKEPKDRWQ